MPERARFVERDTMTLLELASRLGIGKTVAYELAMRNELPVPVFRVGRRYLVSRRQYEAFLERTDTVRLAS